VVDYVSNNLNDETKIYSAEFLWPFEDKSFSCASLKPAIKGQQEELRFTLMFLSVITFLMNCLNLEILKHLIPCLHLMR
jgi:hypothetical protein